MPERLPIGQPVMGYTQKEITPATAPEDGSFVGLLKQIAVLVQGNTAKPDK
jgi:hypothetical protein